MFRLDIAFCFLAQRSSDRKLGKGVEMNGKATGSWEGIRWPALPGANRGASHRYLCYNLESAGQVQFLAGLRPVFAKYSIGREERGDAIAEEGGLRSSFMFPACPGCSGSFLHGGSRT